MYEPARCYITTLNEIPRLGETVISHEIKYLLTMTSEWLHITPAVHDKVIELVSV